MITGVGGGKGTYSVRSAQSGVNSVTVAHMPEDSWNVRISFRHQEEDFSKPIKMTDTFAKLLWSSLNQMAKDLKWEDYETK